MQLSRLSPDASLSDYISRVRAIPRLDRAPDEDDTARIRADDGAHCDLRIEIEDVAAVRADEPFRLARFEEAAFESASASRAEPVGMRIVVRVQLEIGHVPV